MNKLLTHDIPGIGGKIKQNAEDFIVSERLSFPMSGEGEYLYIEVEKRHTTTFEVIKLLRRHLRLRKADIGHAGLKDAKAITTQYFSLFKVTENDLNKLNLRNIKILSIARHHKKLKLGNIKGNFFSILIRDSNENIQAVTNSLEILKKRGVPNYFGEQRFGNSGNTHLLGKYLLQEKYDLFIETLFCVNSKNIHSNQYFKELFQEKKYKEAYEKTPKHFEIERKVLQNINANKKLSTIISSISKQMKFFYICAYQSHLFNISLSKRIQNIDNIQLGDLAVLHPTRSVFLVTDPRIEQVRCKNQEISPSGPIFGYKMINPQGEQLKLEENILNAENLDTSIFKQHKIQGERRAYRFFAEEIEIEKISTGIKICFFLTKGCYATTVIKEITKVCMDAKCS